MWNETLFAEPSYIGMANSVSLYWSLSLELLGLPSHSQKCYHCHKGSQVSHVTSLGWWGHKYLWPSVYFKVLQLAAQLIARLDMLAQCDHMWLQGLLLETRVKVCYIKFPQINASVLKFPQVPSNSLGVPQIPAILIKVHHASRASFW